VRDDALLRLRGAEDRALDRSRGSRMVTPSVMLSFSSMPSFPEAAVTS